MDNNLHFLGAKAFADLARMIAGVRPLCDRQAELAGQIIGEHQRIFQNRRTDLEEQLEDAERHLDELDEDSDDYHAQAQVDDALSSIRHFDDVQSRYESARIGFEGRLSELSRASGRLIQSGINAYSGKESDARGYETLRMNDNGSGSSGRSSARSSGRAATLSASGKGGAAAAISKMAKKSSAANREGLPDGFAWVDLNEIAEDGFVDAPEGFKKIDKSKMENSTRILRDELLPMVKANPSITKSDIERFDHERGTAYDQNGFIHPDSLAVVWTAFLSQRSGDEVIRIGNINPDGSLDVQNGRHRLGVAREMGIRFMPVKFGGV